MGSSLLGARAGGGRAPADGLCLAGVGAMTKYSKIKESWRAYVAHSVERVTLDLKVLSLSPMLNVEIT